MGHELSGEIRLFFQQAEEIGQGARQFISSGLLDGVQAILGTHVSSAIPVGSIALTAGATNASCDFFRITVRGASAHVSTPHLGTDAAYIAAKIVVDLQSIVARHTNPLDPVVVGVGVIKAGTNYNIIANEAVIEGTTRTFSKETRERTNSAVAKLAELAAEANGGIADVHFEDYAAPLVNDATITERAQKIAAKFANEKEILKSIPKSLGADDFADYLQVVPGTYAFIGSKNATNESTAKPHHNELFDIDERAILIASQMYVEFALDILKNQTSDRDS
jgi:amidohydrolase